MTTDDEDVDRDETPSHLEDDTRWLRWNWNREDPVEIVLLIFILLLCFLLPRPECGISDKGGSVSDGAPAPVRASNQ